MSFAVAKNAAAEEAAPDQTRHKCHPFDIRSAEVDARETRPTM